MHAYEKVPLFLRKPAFIASTIFTCSNIIFRQKSHRIIYPYDRSWVPGVSEQPAIHRSRDISRQVLHYSYILYTHSHYTSYPLCAPAHRFTTIHTPNHSGGLNQSHDLSPHPHILLASNSYLRHLLAPFKVRTPIHICYFLC